MTPPLTAREDKEEFKCDVPDGIGRYFEKHFRMDLSKERITMLRRHPKPDTAVMAPPKCDPFILDFAPKKIDIQVLSLFLLCIPLYSLRKLNFLNLLVYLMLPFKYLKGIAEHNEYGPRQTAS